MQGIQEVFDGTAHKTPEHTQIELEHQSSYDRDRDELARLGKKQVLKVRTTQTSVGYNIDHETAQLWLHVDAWLLLYNHGNMGGHVGVRRSSLASPLTVSDQHQVSSLLATKSQ